MTKSELSIKLAAERGITEKVAEQVVGEVFGAMTETLIADGRIEIRGFGSFINRRYEARAGRNPKTGESIKVKSKLTPFFKTGLELKARVLAGVPE